VVSPDGDRYRYGNITLYAEDVLRDVVSSIPDVVKRETETHRNEPTLKRRRANASEPM
jgi:hypothetical protein